MTGLSLAGVFATTADLLMGQLPATLSPPAFEWYGPLPPPELLGDQWDPAIEQPGSRYCCDFRQKQTVAMKGLQRHEYLAYGATAEAPSGHIYTANGGFLDIGHVRDQADLTRFLAVKARAHLKDGSTLTLKRPDFEAGPLGAFLDEGERQVVFLPQGKEPDLRTCALVGARLAYDLAVWHELATYGGPNDGSSFSPDDNYSNLLGSWIGYRAMLFRYKNYTEAVASLLPSVAQKLDPLDAVNTKKALDYVDGLWFDHSPIKSLLRRHVEPYGQVTPWLATEVINPDETELLVPLRAEVSAPRTPTPIEVPEYDLGTEPRKRLSTYARIEIATMGDWDAVPDNQTEITSAQFPGFAAGVRQDLGPDETTPGQPVPQ